MSDVVARLGEETFEALRAATGKRPAALSPLSGGCVAEVYRVDLEGGGACVVKRAPADAGPEEDGGLAVEAAMLAYLARESDLPVPAVLHADETLLVIEFIATAGGLDAGAESHAAELLAGSRAAARRIL